MHLWFCLYIAVYLDSNLKVSLVQLSFAVLLSCPSFNYFMSFTLSLAFSYRLLLTLSRVHPITQTMGIHNTDCTTVSKTFYFTFSGLAPSQWGRYILSARCLRIHSFSCQTRLLCGLSSYLFCFLSRKATAACCKVKPIVFPISFLYHKTCRSFGTDSSLRCLVFCVTLKTFPIPISCFVSLWVRHSTFNWSI